MIVMEQVLLMFDMIIHLKAMVGDKSTWRLEKL